MNVKLTLSLDEKAVEKGKRFAASQNTSLSQLVQTYFILLDSPGVDSGVEIFPVSQKLQSLVGIGAGSHDESDYKKHLEKKHSQ